MKTNFVCVVVAVLWSSSARAEAPPSKLVEACAQAMRLGDAGALGFESFARACGLLTSGDCRDAWQRAETIGGGGGRLKAIVDGCTRTYCEQLRSASLCSPTARWLPEEEVAASWAGFQQAILVKEHGEQVAARLAEPMTKTLLQWTGVRVAPRPAEVTLRLRVEESGVVVEAFDSKKKKRWNEVVPNAPLSAEKLQSLQEALGPIQRRLGPGSACVRFEGSPDVGYTLMTQLIRAFATDTCADLDFVTLYKQPLR